MNRVLLLLILASVGLSSKGQVPTYNYTNLGNLQYLVGGLNGTNFCPRVTSDYMFRTNPLSIGPDHAASLSYGQHISSLGGSVGGQLSYFEVGVNDFVTFDLIYNYNLRISRRWTIRLGAGGGIGNERSEQLGKDLINPRGEGSILAYSSNAMVGLSYQRSSVIAWNMVGGRKFTFDRFSSYPILFGRYEMLSVDSGFRRWMMGLTLPISFEKWTYGLSATTTLRDQWRFGGLIGRKITPTLSVMYSLGGAENLTEGNAYYVDYQHQLSLQWDINCKAKKRTFRTISCPSWGGGVSVTTSSNSYKGSSSVKSSGDFKPGTLTAAHINDLSKWKVWSESSKEQLSTHQKTWRISPSERYAVQANHPDGRPIVDAKVHLLDEYGEKIWSSRTDNLGRAELWKNMFGDDNPVASIEIESEFGSERISQPITLESGVNTVVIDQQCDTPSQIDIMFAVDATGSMGDEMDYLKVELNNIIERVVSDDVDIRTGALVYRCKNNTYLTRSSGFSGRVSSTTKFLKDQSAGEGGVESVEVALDEAVRGNKWSENAKARLLFFVLDEAPGTQDSILRSMESSIRLASQKGIRIIPLIASGYSRSLEYLMRSMAMATNGSSAFLTNHSGVGDDHKVPTTDEYDVELLNDLIVRLIKEYTYVPECSGPFPDPSIAQDTVDVNIVAHVVVDKTEEDDQESSDSSEVEKTKEINYSFRFYPNPAHDQITIEIDGEMDYLYLCDMSGRLIRRIQVEGKNRLYVDVGDLSPGIYLIQYRSGKKAFTGKMVKG